MEQVNELTLKQLNKYKKICNIYTNYVNNYQGSYNVGAIEARIENLNKVWSDYQVTDTQIRQLENDETKTLEYFVNPNCQVDVVEDKYLESLGNFYELRNKLIKKTSVNIAPARGVSSSLSSFEPTIQRKLPPIPIPKFNGAYKDWIFFKTLFKDLVVDSTTLTSAEQLAYLKSSLSEEPLAMIANLTVQEGRFKDEVWKKLTNHYDNNRNIIYAYINSLIYLKGCKEESEKLLRDLGNNTADILQSLKALGSPIEHWDHFLVPLTADRLDSITRKEWETSIGNTTVPVTHQTLIDFILKKADALKSASRPAVSSKSFTVEKQFKSVKSHNINKTSSKSKCSFCSNDHFILFCSDFKSKSHTEKLSFVKSKNLCFNCLGNHAVKNCTNSKRCLKCKRKHHTSLHDSFATIDMTSSTAGTIAVTSVTDTPDQIQSNLNVNSAVFEPLGHNQSPSQQLVLLGTAMVKIASASGEIFNARALVDSGSEVSFVSESLVQRLGLTRYTGSTSVSGIGTRPTLTKGSTSFIITSRIDNEIKYTVNAFIMTKLSSYLPRCTSCPNSWNFIEGLLLADPAFYSKTKVDILLGADIYALIIQEGVRKGQIHEPIAQCTSLGWILTCSVGSSNNIHSSQQVSIRSDEFIDDLIAKFWEVESVPEPSSTVLMSKDDRDCELHFSSTYSRDHNGKFILRLPFKYSKLQFSKSHSVASRCFIGLEKRFAINSELESKYVSFMSEYLILEHMQLSKQLAPQEISDSFFIPHHGLFKDKKLRVVFNASSKSHGSLSLNDCLLVGPSLQSNIIIVLCRWRFFQFVYTADIAKMYRQIWIHPDDRKYQRILWRSNPVAPLDAFDLCTVTYGVAPSAYQAIRCLKELAHLESKNYPAASESVLNNMYVDDILFGADSISESIQLAHDISSLLMAGGFPLRKWNANHQEMLSEFPPDWLSDKVKNLSDNSNGQKLLGLIWSAETDSFTFVNTLQDIAKSSINITKRSVLSAISKLYDPLGLVSPIIIKSKIFMASLWLKKLDWDDPLPEDCVKVWKVLSNELCQVDKIKVPRWIFTNKDSDFELHGFSDASTEAIAACIYIRVFQDNDCQVNLLISKSKVAPKKTLSVPRLELCATVLLAKLAHALIDDLAFKDKVLHLWTDSTITFTWLNSSPHLWSTFVSHRVAEIQRLLPTAIWHHIDGNLNPADSPTRGESIDSLIVSDRWWHGPEFLRSTYRQFHIDPAVELSISQCPEIRKVNRIINSNVVNTQDSFEFLERFSSYTVLLKHTAWWRRLCYNLHAKTRNFPLYQSAFLTAYEFDQARLFWIRQAQRESFPDEIFALFSDQVVSRKSKILKFNPFIDKEDDLLRVGGRLRHSSLPYNIKHPVLLSPESKFTKLLISYFHVNRTLHGGTQLTLSALRNFYWIISGRRAVNFIISRCTVCIRHRGSTVMQQMGDLPKSRITINMPFSHVGVDYAGPIKVRISSGRGRSSVKGYICVFVCFVTKAVHLEAVTGYDTAHFMMALKRFVSRRGLCNHIYSDQGKNFEGAANEIRKLFLNKSFIEDIARKSSDLNIQWHFNPPAAPHFGGLWEAAVKSTKKHLVKVIGESTLTYEELSTVLTCVEACLNSRPLSKISDDINDCQILTPAHFLIGRSLIAFPESDDSDTKISMSHRWKMLKQIRDDFWKRWQKDYLFHMQERLKWFHPNVNLKEGDIVLLKDERTSPVTWPMARVTKLHPADDGLVRVVTVKFAKSELQRPVHKLVLLPMDDIGNQGQD